MRKTALLLIVFQFCGHAQAAPWQNCLQGAVSVPLEHYNAPPSMLGSIDGLPARFFLAPQASDTFIFANHNVTFLGSAPEDAASETGEATVFLKTLSTVNIGALILKSYTAYVVDYSVPNTIIPPLQVELGEHFLSHISTLIDRSSRNVTFFRYDDEKCPSIGDLLPSPTTKLHLYQDGYPLSNTVLVELNGHPVRMKINLSSNRTLIQKDTARAIGIASEPDKDDPVRINAGNTVGGYLHTFDTLKIGSFLLPHPKIVIASTIAYDELGADALNHFHILLDPLHATIWLSPASDPSLTKEPPLPWTPLHIRKYQAAVHDKVTAPKDPAHSGNDMLKTAGPDR
ncbi:MAG: retropepsin-like aspartic protease [Gluconobacter sp.]|uniref:retropepsin-like aspartic protease n=1 Tax=Gluconobacter sp. TaxID=1876758 RepID=UPI0039EB92FD